MLRRWFQWIIALCASVGMASCMDAEREAAAIKYRSAEIQPIECHARFVDQDKRPLANVRIKAEVITKQLDGGIAESKELDGILTDKDGVIHITGENGGYLRLVVDDLAYTQGNFPPNISPGVVFRYSQNTSHGIAEHGTSTAPFTIEFWRKEGPQALISLKGKLLVPYTDQPLRLDLAKGQLVDEGGDLMIEVKAEPTEELRRKSADQRGYFPYEMTLIAMSGGLSALEWSADKSDWEWLAGIVAIDFPLTKVTGKGSSSYAQAKGVEFNGFLRIEKRKLQGRLRIAVGMERYWRNENGRIVILIDDALLNPSGSRSLEIDPARLTKLTLTDGRAEAQGKP